jgi:hypothetical protein
MKLGPPFWRRFYLAASTPGIQWVRALDEQGQQIARFPLVPDPACPGC